MITKTLSILSILILSGFILPQVYSFEVDSFNMTLTDVQKTQHTNYDLVQILFSLFNGGTEQVVFSGHSMLYLNDTNYDNWEHSSYMDLEGYSSSDCPELDTYVTPGNSIDVKLCYIITDDPTVGYSLILNDNRYFKDSNIKVFVLESVPDWFKSTAGFWCSDAITDSDFVNSTQFYIQDGAINVLRVQSGTDAGATIPAWVKSNACLWDAGQISEYEFLDGIYWLIDNGKIQI